MTDYGIDISSWNAVNDWDAVHGNGIAFASIKVTEGTGYTSPDASAQANSARNAGIAAGGYHFAQPDTDPAAQAQFFAAECSARGLLLPGSFVPMLDVEAAGLTDAFVSAFINAFRVYSGQSKIAVYANGSWFQGVLHPDQWADADVVLWIAVWNGDPGNPGWSHPRLALHQHTDAGTVPGVAGNVDRDCTVASFTIADVLLGSVPVPVPSPTPAPEPPADSYTVQPGDTLTSIAAMWGTTVSAVAVANGIADVNLIQIGQVLHKPGTAPVVPGDSYTVQPGDTVSGLAAVWGTTVAAIVAVNHLADPNRIYVGQVLVKPSSTPPAQRTYTVQSGDTLSGIAAQEGVDWTAIQSANGITDPNLIYPGQVLIIP